MSLQVAVQISENQWTETREAQWVADNQWSEVRLESANYLRFPESLWLLIVGGTQRGKSICREQLVEEALQNVMCARDLIGHIRPKLSGVGLFDCVKR